MNHSEHARRRITEHWTTKEGERVAWADVETRHLWNIARMRVRTARRATRSAELTPAQLHARLIARAVAAGDTLHAEGLRRRNAHSIEASHRITQRLLRARAGHAHRDVTMAIDELDYRGALPTWDDLRVAWDRACGGDGGPNVADDPEQRPWCLIELWVGFRGEPTTSAEWEAARRDHEPGTLA